MKKEQCSGHKEKKNKNIHAIAKGSIGAFCTLWITLCLVTFNPHDPSLLMSSSAPDNTISIAAGSLGAQCAALLNYFFGFPAFL